MSLEQAQEATLKYMRHHRQFPREVYDWRSVDGLWHLCDMVPDGSKMVELGSYWGESTMFFWKSGKFASIVAVDPGSPDNGGPQSNDTIKNNVIAPSSGTVTLLEKSGHEAVGLFRDESLDLVYIDANHAYEHALEDIRDWLPKVKPGGIIAGHDYALDGVRKAVDKLLGPPDEVFTDTSWMVRKPAVASCTGPAPAT